MPTTTNKRAFRTAALLLAAALLTMPSLGQEPCWSYYFSCVGCHNGMCWESGVSGIWYMGDKLGYSCWMTGNTCPMGTACDEFWAYVEAICPGESDVTRYYGNFCCTY